jgi:TetR/AcrR family transcriptional regulator
LTTWLNHLVKMKTEPAGTETRILEAAKKVFHRKGFEGARMQEIADEAGINKSLLHYYFRNKENLFNSVFREALQEIFSRLFTIAGEALPLEEKIRLIFNDYISFLQQNSYIPGFILTEIRQNPKKLAQIFKAANISPTALYEKMKTSIGDESVNELDHKSFIINLLSLCIFPFAARPLLQIIFDFSEDEYDLFIEKRKKELPEFFMNAIRKQ